MEFAPTVLLVDVAFLNHSVKGMRNFMQAQLSKELHAANLGELVDMMLYQVSKVADLGEGKIQVLLVHDDNYWQMTDVEPSDLRNELNNVAVQTFLGEASFYTFTPAAMVTKDAFMLDALKALAESEKVKNLLLFADDREEIEGMDEALLKAEKKKVRVKFEMVPKEDKDGVLHVTPGFAIWQSIGVNYEDLKEG